MTAVTEYAEGRIRMQPPLDHPRSVEELTAEVGATITRQGIGGIEALNLFADKLAPMVSEHAPFNKFAAMLIIYAGTSLAR